MTSFPRLPRIHHCTSAPYRFFGRSAELALLQAALGGGEPSVLALVGPGGQGKTAIVQHWLESVQTSPRPPDGIFLWSFYRGKDADLCLRELLAYAEGLAEAPDVSASYCVDHLLSVLRRECWAIILDGTEVVQYDTGPWFGRFVHPELSRLLEQLASAPTLGVAGVTTRFPLPELERRKHAQVLSLGGLDSVSARGLLTSLGVRGSASDLDAAAEACGFHAKAVELLATFLACFEEGNAQRWSEALPQSSPPTFESRTDEEQRVARVLAAYQNALPPETQDILALATAFREPPTEERLRDYLTSLPVQTLLHQTWDRSYKPFAQRPADWLVGQIEELVHLRLLERVGSQARLPGNRAGAPQGSRAWAPEASRVWVLDAHPLVRRAFEHVLGVSGHRQSALARAGFLRGRPDRQRPDSLEEACEEVELFHAYCDAGLWNEADGVYVALDNPKHRLVAPVFERDLLLLFFPEGDWRKPPLWPGFGRYRSLAICFELLGQFDDALSVYRDTDKALRGDALIALGRLQPLLDLPQVPHPWQTLWLAYRAHALCLTGCVEEATVLARTLVPVDIYEWVHVFECLLRAGQLKKLDLTSVLYRPPHAAEHRWANLARQRMRADYLRLTANPPPPDLAVTYETLIESYDRGGLPYERALTRLSYARWLMANSRLADAATVIRTLLAISQRHQMRILEADAWRLVEELASVSQDHQRADAARSDLLRLRRETGYDGPPRP